MNPNIVFVCAAVINVAICGAICWIAYLIFIGGSGWFSLIIAALCCMFTRANVSGGHAERELVSRTSSDKDPSDAGQGRAS